MKKAYAILRALGVGALVLSLGFPSPLLINVAQADPAPTPSAAPSPPAPPDQDCDKSCEEYKGFTGNSSEEKTASAIDTYCGKAPDDPKSKDINGGFAGEDFFDCQRDTINRYKMLGPGCDAKDMYDSAQTSERNTLIAYGAATAVCAVTCYTGYATWVCTLASFGAMGYDIFEMSNLGAKGNDKVQTWANVTSKVAGGGAAVAELVQFSGSMAKGTTDAATKQNQQVAKAACWVGVAMLAAATIIKGISYAQMGSGKDDACKAIKGYSGFGSMPTMAIAPPPDNSKKAGPGGQKPPGSGQGMGGHQSGGNGGSLGKIGLEGDTFPQAMMDAATAGPAGQLFKALNLERTPAELKAATGMTLAQFGDKLTGGTSLADLAGGIAGMPSDAVAMLKDVEKAVKDGEIYANDTPGATAGGGGGGGGGGGDKKAGPGVVMGSKAPAVAKEMGFEKRKADPALLENGDIWHEGYAGSIFQIVSQKLVKTRERIDQLEWATPLNRALAGLPAKPGSRPGLSPQAAIPAAAPAKSQFPNQNPGGK